MSAPPRDAHSRRRHCATNSTAACHDRRFPPHPRQPRTHCARGQTLLTAARTAREHLAAASAATSPRSLAHASSSAGITTPPARAPGDVSALRGRSRAPGGSAQEGGWGDTNAAGVSMVGTAPKKAAIRSERAAASRSATRRGAGEGAASAAVVAGAGTEADFWRQRESCAAASRSSREEALRAECGVQGRGVSERAGESISIAYDLSERALSERKGAARRRLADRSFGSAAQRKMRPTASAWSMASRTSSRGAVLPTPPTMPIDVGTWTLLPVGEGEPSAGEFAAEASRRAYMAQSPRRAVSWGKGGEGRLERRDSVTNR